MSNAWIVETDLLFDGSGRAPERDRAVLVRDGRIAGVGATDAGAAIPRLRCPVLAPGFLDIQINGAADAQFNDDPSVETLRRMARGAAQGGSAWILPTFITAPGRAYAEALDAVAAALGAGVPGIAGLHLEGPFLSPRRAGIHPPEAIRRPDATDLARLEAPGGGARLVTLAPEEVGPDAVARLSAAGWTVFAGHSEATAEDLVPAVAAGLSGATHLFNAMSQMTPRAPGLVGAVLGGLVPHAGLIADGHHVHPLSLAAALKAVGADRLCLVTDAMLTLAGTRTGFRIGAREVRLDGGRLVGEDGTLGGAHLAMDEAVRNMIALAGATPQEAIRMASATPAAAVGLGDEIGTIRPGQRAGLTLMDAGLRVLGTMSDGAFPWRDAALG